MDAERIAARVAELSPAEVPDALFLVSICEGRSTSPDEAAEWRRRILARAVFLGLSADVWPADDNRPVVSAVPRS